MGSEGSSSRSGVQDSDRSRDLIFTPMRSHLPRYAGRQPDGPADPMAEVVKPWRKVDLPDLDSRVHGTKKKPVEPGCVLQALEEVAVDAEAIRVSPPTRRSLSRCHLLQ